MADIRLVATDVDGTLCDSADRIRPAVRQAVGDCLSRGVTVLVATGRTAVTARTLVAELGYDVPLVLANGALVHDSITEAPWSCRLLPAETAREAVTAQREAGFEPLVYEDPRRGDDVYYERRHPTNQAFVDSNLERADQVPDLLAWLEHPVLLTATFGTQEQIRALTAELNARLAGRALAQPLWHPLYDSWSLDVMPSGCTKWVAVSEYAQRHGIAPEQVLAIGDSLNDVPMIDGAGLGVAMGNSLAEVKHAADAVVADNDHDGFAEAMQRFVLASSGGPGVRPSGMGASA